jgi:hypothetical protein
VKKSAIISECGEYRYRLERDFGDEPQAFAFFGVNPSTADSIVDDQTVMKWVGFSRRNGAGRFIVGNVFAFRATNVKELASAGDPVGVENTEHIRGIIRDADILVPCWGNRAKVPKPLRWKFSVVAALLRESGKPVRCFGVTKSGDPKHPLMLPYTTELIDFPSA